MNQRDKHQNARNNVTSKMVDIQHTAGLIEGAKWKLEELQELKVKQENEFQKAIGNLILTPPALQQGDGEA